MRNFILISIIIFALFVGCKSTKQTKNNQLDVTTVKTEKTQNTINLSQLDLIDNEILLIAADPKKETIITDGKGNQQTFKNVKSVTIKSTKLQKKDSVTFNKKDADEKMIDKSTIKESKENVSDAKNFKGIFIAIAFSLLFVMIIYLVFKFKK